MDIFQKRQLWHAARNGLRKTNTLKPMGKIPTEGGEVSGLSRTAPVIVFDENLRVAAPTVACGVDLPPNTHVLDVPQMLGFPDWLPGSLAFQEMLQHVLSSGIPRLFACREASADSPYLTVLPRRDGNGSRILVCQAEPLIEAVDIPQGAAALNRTLNSPWYGRKAGATAHRFLLETLSRLKSAVEAAEIGTFYVPLPMGLIYWNAKCAEHFWMKPSDLVIDFDLFYSRLHPDDRARTRAAVEAAVGSGQNYDIEYRSLSEAGEVRWIRAKGGVRRDDCGTPVRFDGITIDVSKQKRLEHDRAHLLQNERLQRIEAEQDSQMKDTFIATASHELRTPLTAILGWVELLQRKPEDEGFVRRGAEVIRRNAMAQIRLVDDLLDSSRVAAGKLHMESGAIDLAEALEAEILAIEPLALRKRVALERSFASVAPVAGDAARLRQVFSNILTNALKHTASGGRIRVTLADDGASARIMVKDNGEGIPREFLETIFASFAQVDGSTTRKHGGLGLGLAISRKLVELHGGKIFALSDGPGKGATFVITLPHRAEQLGLAHGSIVPGPAVVDAPQPRLDGIRVLLVEDDADSLEALSEILLSSGVVVHSATSAAKADEILCNHSVDCLFSDICMPDEDGYSFISKLRTSGFSKPAFAVTALARSSDIDRALAAGFTGHLAKPVSAAVLVSLLRKLAVSHGGAA
ncbi:ATP-binding protein (plasmid) [Paraburkholderia sp. D15]|uniref:ATP-binding response regulator n=1 Tax=Paraburkholderia sp. D15 TaxID=2880218 RepID=UPI0024786C54|nr:hybrid sensor histidine kinase/response regulator [Paraburkholderia sp. D15]WGS54945.1 ATP-binding protein [Paraburkholderia sp. D15]